MSACCKFLKPPGGTLGSLKNSSFKVQVCEYDAMTEFYSDASFTSHWDAFILIDMFG